MKRKKILLGAALAGAMTLGTLASSFAEDITPTDTQLAQMEHRGGTIRIVASSAGGTIDPHINYTLQYWMLYQATYDGLMAFKRTSGEEGFQVVPDLATDMPVMSNDGKTLTFTLRSGIKFSDGSDLDVGDVLASFQRIFKVSSPTAGGFYAGIVGADKCLADPATCTLDGGVVVDAATNSVTLNLTAPDAEIFYKLALPHAAILPAEAPTSDVGTVPIAGTGPYMFESYDPNTQLKMVRNPHFVEWSKEAQPDGYADVIIEDFGLTGEAQVTAVQNEEADFMFDQIPVDRLAEVGANYADQVHINTLTAVWYAPMNVNIAPFNDVRVRQAVNYAIDRNALVNLFGGPNLAQPVCQVLPPGFPGHVDYCPYTLNPEANVWSAPDMEKAKALVAESGTAGQEVTVIAEDNEVARSIGTYLASVLTELGYNATMKAISSNIHFTYIQNTNNNVQISVTQWYQDYPAASDFLYILLSCDTFNPGSDSSINIAGYCDEAMTKRMTDALALGVTDQAAADAEWAKIDHDVMDVAPWAPLFTPKKLDFVSKRLGNYTFSPQFYWIVSQSWVQ